MFRCAISAIRNIRPFAIPYCNAARIFNNDIKRFSSCRDIQIFRSLSLPQNSLLKNSQVLSFSNTLNHVPVRTVTKFSLKSGKRKTVKAVTRRFFRLDWGGWIRTKCGRHKKMWKKSLAQKRRLRQHVFCNSTQATLLDKMVTKYWKKPKYYVDDPYAPYHTREEFVVTRKMPRK